LFHRFWFWCHRRTLEGTDLIVWLQTYATSPVEMVFTPQ
jgi:hypothetical protein